MEPVGAVQITAGLEGIDPQDLLDWIEDFDGDVWEALYALWESMYD